MHTTQDPKFDHAAMDERLALHDELVAKICDLTVSGKVEDETLESLTELSDSICRALEKPTKESVARADLQLNELTAAVNNLTVNNAMDSTKCSDPEYFERLFACRAGLPGGRRLEGPPPTSIYPDLSASGLEKELRTRAWQPYSHPALTPGCLAFRAEIPGVCTLIDLSELPGETSVVLSDPCGSGRLSACVTRDPRSGSRQDFTVILLGPNDTSGRLELWTFNAGSPIRPRELSEEGLAGRKVSPKQAIELGLDFARLVLHPAK